MNATDKSYDRHQAHKKIEIDVCLGFFEGDVLDETFTSTVYYTVQYDETGWPTNLHVENIFVKMSDWQQVRLEIDKRVLLKTKLESRLYKEETREYDRRVQESEELRAAQFTDEHEQL